MDQSERVSVPYRTNEETWTEKNLLTLSIFFFSLSLSLPPLLSSPHILYCTVLILMDSITAQSQVKVAAVASPKANPKTKKSNYRNKSSPKASSKPALSDNQPQQKQQQSKKSSPKVAATNIAVPPQRKNTPRSSNRPSQSKKSNSSHRKHSLSAHSNASSSSEDNVPSLMYASTSGTDSDDSDHLDTQLAYGMYSMDINNRCVAYK